MGRTLRGLVLLSAAAVALALPVPTAAGQTGLGEAAVIRRHVEDFLERLGSRQVESLEADFMPDAVIIVSRQTKEGFQNGVQPLSAWLAGLRRNPDAPRFREPLTNIQVTIESGHLAHLRADFQVIRDGAVISSGVDHFVLVRQPAGWKIAAVAYTSIPAQ